MEKTAVTVKIFNDEYTLKTDLPRTDVDAIAAMVDKKMQKLATSQHLVTTSKVAVWAALDLAGELYTLRREYNLDVNIPDIAKKLLKNAFRLKRTDTTNLNTLHSTVELGANLPFDAKGERKVTGNGDQLDVTMVWTVKVEVPLSCGMLEKHAEGEIRKFTQVEPEIVEEEDKKQLQG